MNELTHKTAQSLARKGTRLREFAYQAIKDAILAGSINTDLPLVEERLAEKLQISRTPVREALAILEHEGLLESIPYQGLFVRDITVTEFLEMYETVELIEPELARRAAHHVNAQDLTTMAQLLEQARQAIPDDISTHLKACRMFQVQLGSCARQQHLAALLLSIEERSDLYLIGKKLELPTDHMLAAITDRQDILTALQAGDPEQAALASRRHARAIRQRWHTLYREP